MERLRLRGRDWSLGAGGGTSPTPSPPASLLPRWLHAHKGLSRGNQVPRPPAVTPVVGLPFWWVCSLCAKPTSRSGGYPRTETHTHMLGVQSTGWTPPGLLYRGVPSLRSQLLVEHPDFSLVVYFGNPGLRKGFSGRGLPGYRAEIMWGNKSPTDQIGRSDQIPLLPPLKWHHPSN